MDGSVSVDTLEKLEESGEMVKPTAKVRRKGAEAEA
jgi:hypothetical protein